MGCVELGGSESATRVRVRSPIFPPAGDGGNLEGNLISFWIESRFCKGKKIVI